MRHWFFLFFTILCCGTFLFLDIWPGWLPTLLYESIDGGRLCPIYVWMFPLGYLLWRLMRFTLHLDALKPSVKPPEKKPRRLGIARWVIMGITFVLWLVDVPKRIVFAMHVHEFEKWLIDVPKEEKGKKIYRYIGPYFVDRYGSHSKFGEGVYFRVNQRFEENHFSRRSYGFVYKPNQQGTPFGSSRYTYGHLFGDWYWFGVSDDLWEHVISNILKNS